jgi:hypothetical protein
MENFNWRGSMTTPTTQREADERALFEAWFEVEHPLTLQDDADMRFERAGDEYFSCTVQNLWEVWQARAALAQSEAPALPRANGVSRDAEWPKAMLVFFERELTDDEMRALHDKLAQRAAPEAPTIVLHDSASSLIKARIAATTASASLDDVLGPQRWSKEAEMTESWLAQQGASHAANAGEDTERDAIDAARYRFLREADLDAIAAGHWQTGRVVDGVKFDDAIDAAIAASAAEQKGPQ